MSIHGINTQRWGSLIGVLLLSLAAGSCLNVGEGKHLPVAAKNSATAPAQFVELSKGFVRYELSGPTDAQMVVLIPGFSAPYYVWDPTVEFLTKAGFRTLRFDLYGRGWSDRPKIRYELDLYVSQLEELLD